MAILIAVAVYILPMYLLVVLSLKKSSDVSSPLNPWFSPTLENFGEAWREAHLGQALANSVVVTAGSTVLVVVLAALAAYPLARSTRRLSTAVFYLFLIGLVLPFQLATVPLYTTFRDLHLLGGLTGMVAIYVGTQLPFAVFVYTTFLRNSERDYEDAARIDGCGHLRVWWYVIFPLARAVTGTVGILTAVFVWNDFYGSLLFLSGDKQTVPIALYGFVGTYFTQWNLVFAGLVISVIPLLAIYFVMQKSIIQGFAGGLKG